MTNTKDTLERYGLRWIGSDNAVIEPMDDGYWTPWHIAEAREAELLAVIADLADDCYDECGDLTESHIKHAAIIKKARERE